MIPIKVVLQYGIMETRSFLIQGDYSLKFTSVHSRLAILRPLPFWLTKNWCCRKLRSSKGIIVTSLCVYLQLDHTYTCVTIFPEQRLLCDFLKEEKNDCVCVADDLFQSSRPGDFDLFNRDFDCHVSVGRSVGMSVVGQNV